HFESIIARLFDNACKFSPSGAVITIASRNEKERYIISVTDNGNGIPLDKQDGLFQKFYQVNRETQEQQGAGLGLYIAKKLAEFNKCILWCESEEGKGAAFHLSIRKKG
ncbi:MAG: ATP-binding protein, partial [Bacteroidota bacterium]